MWCQNKFLFAIVQSLAGVVALGGISTITPVQPALAQTLDAAVERQLIYSCAVLLDGQDPLAALTGTLQQICSYDYDDYVTCPGCEDDAPVSPNSASGGSAAAPTKLPGIIERRLREARANNSGSATVGAASADAISTFPSGLSAFFSGQSVSLDKAVTASEAGYDSELWRITAGIDYDFTPDFSAGLAVDTYQHEGSLNGDGNFDDESTGFIAYGMLTPTDEFYFQFHTGYARIDHQRERFAAWGDNLDYVSSDGDIYGFVVTGGTISGNFYSEQFRAGGLGGYDFILGNVTVGLRIGLDWSVTRFSALVENGTQTQADNPYLVPVQGSTGLELRFDENERTSLQTMMGLHAQSAFPINSIGILLPHVSVDWKHEFKLDQHDIYVNFVEAPNGESFSYESEKPDRDWIDLGAGLTLSLHQRVRLFSNYRTLIGHRLFTSHTLTLGMRTVF